MRRDTNYLRRRSTFRSSRAFWTSGRSDEGLALIDETIRLVEENGDLVFMPELLRVKGNALLCLPQVVVGGSGTLFRNSLEWSRRQGALGWELRTAVDLARFLAEQKRDEGQGASATGIRAVREGLGYGRSENCQ